MVDPQSSRTILEEVHIRYLTENFNLSRNAGPIILSGSRPDLYPKEPNPGCLFELKSRVYPENNARKLGPFQFAWWDLHEEQIIGHEQIMRNNSIGGFWILLLAYTPKLVSETDAITEKFIRWRDIYVVPWPAYKLVGLQGNGRRTIGLNRLYEHYFFRDYSAHKATLSIANNLEDQVGAYFGLD